MKRLQPQHVGGVIVGDLPDLNTTLNQFMVDQGRYQEMAHEIRVIERPPMIEIPAYRTKMELASANC